MIRTETDGDVRIVTLDRPERRNALTVEALEELEEVIESASEPVVYLHGAGEAFCAGADLDTVSQLTREEAVAFAELGQRVTRTIETSRSVVVAGIDGAARGGGVELALACDVRIGTPEATLAETGVALGLFGAWGGTVRLPHIVGEGIALDFSLSGRVLSAEEALDVGLLSRVVEDPRAVADELAANDPAALEVIQRLIRDRSSRERQETREARAFGRLAEHREFE